MEFKYKVIPGPTLDAYIQNGMEFRLDPEQINGILTIEADSEKDADRIRKTFTDIRMWEKI